MPSIDPCGIWKDFLENPENKDSIGHFKSEGKQLFNHQKRCSLCRARLKDFIDRLELLFTQTESCTDLSDPRMDELMNFLVRYVRVNKIMILTGDMSPEEKHHYLSQAVRIETMQMLLQLGKLGGGA
jgi:hypothetical protein